MTHSGAARTRGEQSALELARPARSEAERDARAIARRAAGDPAMALGEIAAELGHAGGRVLQTVSGSRWFGNCGCGYVSTTRNTQRDALDALLHHVRGAIREWHRTGLPLTAARKAPAPDWEEVARRMPHFAAWRSATGEKEPVLGESGDKARAVG